MTSWWKKWKVSVNGNTSTSRENDVQLFPLDPLRIVYIYIFLKNHLYKNVQAEINQILRYLEHTQGVSQSRTTLFFPLIIFVCEKYK